MLLVALFDKVFSLDLTCALCTENGKTPQTLLEDVRNQVGFSKACSIPDLFENIQYVIDHSSYIVWWSAACPLSSTGEAAVKVRVQAS